MASVLNPDTVAHLKQQHPVPERFQQFLATCQQPARQSIRLSESTQSIVLTWASTKSWHLTPIPWHPQGYWITTDDERSLGNHIGHLSGHFYIQEATSMLPVASLINNHQPQLVLDMAAAPGSKTTQLAQSISDDSLVVANDMSSSRTKMLNANLIRMGIGNYALLNKDASQLHQSFSGQFDSILLDAPCGGEGTIRKDPKAWHNWSMDSLKRLSEIQKQLISAAWRYLKPGGRLVYSTCSLSQEENQQVVHHLLEQQHSEAKLIQLQPLFDGSKQLINQGMYHVWPEVMDTEGFFVACIEKSSDLEVVKQPDVQAHKSYPSNKTLSIIISYYAEHFGITLSSDASRYKMATQGNKSMLWLLPSVSMPGARFQRQGIHLCTIIDGRKGTVINTHHDFVRCYGHQAQHNLLSLSSEDTVNYFQGKNLHSNSPQNGELILQFEGRPIGLGKALKGGQIKNQLPRELVHDKAWF